MRTHLEGIPRQYVPLAVGAAIIVVAMLILVTHQLNTPVKPLQTTPRPTQPRTPAPAALWAEPTATAAPTAEPRQIDAYAAPDGVLLGPIEATRPMAPVAHFGSTWVQVRADGSGLVWLRRSDVPDLDVSSLPDLTPPTPAPRADYAPAQNWIAPAVAPPEQPAPEPTAPPAPAPTVIWVPTSTPAGWGGGGGSGW